jgi:peptidoglycan/LPS O-acetylase OafA/YrhL
MPYFGHVPFSRTIAPLNPPAWSLFFEVVASVAFAFGLWSRRRRTITVAFAMIAMMGVLAWTGEYNLGVERFTFPMGFVRVASSFGLGVWLYEREPKVPRLHVGWLALLLFVVLAFPVDSVWLQAVALFAIFPFIVLSGSKGQQWRKLCEAGGDLSYPLYLTHSPLYILLIAAGVGRGLGSVTLALACAIPFAWLVLKVYDEPVRRWLTRLTRQVPNHDSPALIVIGVSDSVAQQPSLAAALQRPSGDRGI